MREDTATFKAILDQAYGGAQGASRQFRMTKRVQSLEEVALRIREMHPPQQNKQVPSDIAACALGQGPFTMPPPDKWGAQSGDTKNVKETLKVNVPAAKVGGARKKGSVTIEVDLGRKRALGGAPVRIFGRKPQLYDFAAAWVYALGPVDAIEGGDGNAAEDYQL